MPEIPASCYWRSKALTDLILTVGIVLVSLPWASPSNSLFPQVKTSNSSTQDAHSEAASFRI